MSTDLGGKVLFGQCSCRSRENVPRSSGRLVIVHPLHMFGSAVDQCFLRCHEPYIVDPCSPHLSDYIPHAEISLIDLRGSEKTHD